jgi:1,4-alpha-glucan branching enzyme
VAYKIGVPEACWYEEVSNSDSKYYGGRDLGNAGGIQALPAESHGRPASMEISLPPLAAVIFKPRR